MLHHTKINFFISTTCESKVLSYQINLISIFHLPFIRLFTSVFHYSYTPTLHPKIQIPMGPSCHVMSSTILHIIVSRLSHASMSDGSAAANVSGPRISLSLSRSDSAVASSGMLLTADWISSSTYRATHKKQNVKKNESRFYKMICIAFFCRNLRRMSRVKNDPKTQKNCCSFLVNNGANLYLQRNLNLTIFTKYAIDDSLTDRYLDVGEWACVSQWPGELCRRELMLLVGPPKLDRSKDRGQTRFDPNPNCRLSMGLTTLSCQNNFVTETAKTAIDEWWLVT